MMAVEMYLSSRRNDQFYHLCMYSRMPTILSLGISDDPYILDIAVVGNEDGCGFSGSGW